MRAEPLFAHELPCDSQKRGAASAATNTAAQGVPVTQR
jgi:hypothetical protein